MRELTLMMATGRGAFCPRGHLPRGGRCPSSPSQGSMGLDGSLNVIHVMLYCFPVVYTRFPALALYRLTCVGHTHNRIQNVHSRNVS